MLIVLTCSRGTMLLLLLYITKCTQNPAVMTRTTDVVITAVAIPHLVHGDWIKHGAFVIDVGLNYIHVNKGTLLMICFCAMHYFENISLSTESVFDYTVNCQPFTKIVFPCLTNCNKICTPFYHKTIVA